MKSFESMSVPIVFTLTICLIGGGMAVLGIRRLCQSVLEIDANLSELQRLREIPCLSGDEVVAERTRVEISNWDMSALADSLGLNQNTLMNESPSAERSTR